MVNPKGVSLTLKEAHNVYDDILSRKLCSVFCLTELIGYTCEGVYS